MQEIILFILFFGIIAYAAYRTFVKSKATGCAHCDFNEDKKA